MDYQKQFASPSSEYRGKPFWAWNGPLDEVELRRQIRVFKEMGLGGAFMHSRVGLATPYLSDEWFSLVNACVEEAKSQEMEAWLAPFRLFWSTRMDALERHLDRLDQAIETKLDTREEK